MLSRTYFETMIFSSKGLLGLGGPRSPLKKIGEGEYNDTTSNFLWKLYQI